MAKRREIKYTSAKETAQKQQLGGDSSCVRIPDEMALFKPKGGKSYRLNFLPYVVNKGCEEPGGNPHAESGFVHYERTYYCHKNVGVLNKWYICPAATFGKKCPICPDLSKKLRAAETEGEQKAIKDLMAKKRQLFVVEDTGDEEAGMQLWDFSYHCFGKQFDAKIEDSDESDKYDEFYYLKGGMIVKVSFADEKGGGYTFPKCSNIEMKPRADDYPEDLLDKVPDLDALLIEVPYDELKRLYEGEEIEEKKDDEKPKGSKLGKVKKEEPEEEDDEPAPKKKPKDEPEEEEAAVGDMVTHPDHGECKVTKILDGGKIKIKNEEGESFTVKIADLEEPEGKPAPKKKVKKEEPEEDEPEEKPKGGKKKSAKKDEEESSDGWDDD